MKLTILLPFSIFILLLISSCKTIEEPEEKVVEPGKTITFDYSYSTENFYNFKSQIRNMIEHYGA